MIYNTKQYRVLLKLPGAHQEQNMMGSWSYILNLNILEDKTQLSDFSSFEKKTRKKIITSRL